MFLFDGFGRCMYYRARLWCDYLAAQSVVIAEEHSVKCSSRITYNTMPSDLDNCLISIAINMRAVDDFVSWKCFYALNCWRTVNCMYQFIVFRHTRGPLASPDKVLSLLFSVSGQLVKKIGAFILTFDANFFVLGEGRVCDPPLHYPSWHFLALETMWHYAICSSLLIPTQMAIHCRYCTLKPCASLLDTQRYLVHLDEMQGAMTTWQDLTSLGWEQADPFAANEREFEHE